MQLINKILLFFILTYNFNVFSQNVAKDFTQLDNNGAIYNLYEKLEQGNTILLDFFSVYCSTCQAAMPNVEQIWVDYNLGSSGVLVWGVETSGVNDSLISNFISNYNISFPVLSTRNNNQIIFDYNISYTPTYVVICPDKKMKTISFEYVRGLIDACTSTYDVPMEHSSDYFISYNKIIFNNYENKTIKVYTLFGNKVFQKQFTENIFLFENIQSGLYLFELKINQTVFKNKIFVY